MLSTDQTAAAEVPAVELQGHQIRELAGHGQIVVRQSCFFRIDAWRKIVLWKYCEYWPFDKDIVTFLQIFD